MSASQYDGGASLFAGGGFMPSQATQTPESSFSKGRGSQSLLPLTVKQISMAYDSNDDKSNFAVDGVETSNVKLLGLVINKSERVTDVTFTLDDGTGRIDINRWVNESSDATEMAIIQNGMYVTVHGSLKGFLGKKHVVAFSVRPVPDFNSVTLHYIECIHVHLENTRSKLQVGGPSQFQANANTFIQTPVKPEPKGYQNPVSNQFSSHVGSKGSGVDVYQMVLDVYQESSSLAREHGLHINDVVQRLGLPVHKIKEAIAYHVDVGHIYSTIDDDHHKSAING